MIDWLRDDHANPRLALADRELPIAIRRHARATRLTMRLAPDGSEIRITMPRWGRTRDALVFARARAEWVEAQLARVPRRLEIAPGARIPYRGGPLEIAWNEQSRRKPWLDEDAARLSLGGPLSSLPARVRRWLEGEALRMFADDLAFYCQRGGEEVPDLRISRAQRRWGSCSGNRDGAHCIRLNWRLAMAPDHVRRSVVAHEVAHLTHFDHSPAFHARLSALYEADIAIADQWLRNEGRNLYAVLG